MLSDKKRPNIDPKSLIRATEPGTYCLMAWEGPCPEGISALYASSHNCGVKVDHRGPHRCSCGRSKRLADDDPTWS